MCWFTWLVLDWIRTNDHQTIVLRKKIQLQTKIVEIVLMNSINEVSLSTVCLHKNVNIHFNYLLNNLCTIMIYINTYNKKNFMYITVVLVGLNFIDTYWYYYLSTSTYFCFRRATRRKIKFLRARPCFQENGEKMGNTNTVSNEFLNSMTQKRKRFVPRFQLVFTYRITSFRLFVLVPSGMRLIGVLIDRFSNWIFAKITYFFT